ncbi:hypothetical protein JCM11641_007032 [Rhodosporidiobolus odoratus]
MAPSPSTSISPSPVGSFRTDKKALLAALADELKREKQRAESAGQKMVDGEAKVEQKHREFMDEEAHLSAQRDANAATIAALRKELAKARQALEDASHVQEHEADAYLSLLSDKQPAAAETGGSGLPRAQFPSQPTSESNLDPGYPLNSRLMPSSHRNETRLSDPTHVAQATGTSPSSARPDHPFQASSPYPNTHSSVPIAAIVSPTAALGRSVWQDSSDGALPADLARNGGKWSKVLPGLKRRNSSRARA